MNRIRGTLELIRAKLEEYFRNQHPHNDDEWVILSNLVSPSGAPFADAEGKLVIFLANIERETSISTFNSARPVKGNQYAVVTPPLYIDLYLLFYANFFDKDYARGLAVISQTLSYFQRTPTFDHQNLPGLDSRIEKLNFEFFNLDSTELNYLMGLTGTTYLPSAFYKVRLIPYADEAMSAAVPAAAGIEVPGTSDGSGGGET